MVFKEILGLPAHALVVHAAVVLVPLLVLLAIAYAVLPRWRSRTGWAAGLLAVAAPVATFVAKESGQELERVLRDKGYPAQILSQIDQHSEYADVLFVFTVGLAVATGLLLFATSGHARARALPSWVSRALSVVVVVLALAAAVGVYRTGHSGAEAVWEGIL